MVTLNGRYSWEAMAALVKPVIRANMTSYQFDTDKQYIITMSCLRF